MLNLNKNDTKIDVYVFIVLVPPEILSVDPEDNVEVLVGGNTTLRCEADGNPPPKYRWLQLKPN